MNDQPQQTVIVPSRPMRATSIKGLIPALPERGKIKIGMKGALRQTKSGNEFQPPIKLDHFVVTTLARGDDNNLLRDETMHERLGDKPTELPIRLLYDDPELNFVSRYAAYKGRALWCSGDGERATRLGPNNQFQEISCPCYLSDPAYTPQNRGDLPRCKMNGSLSVIIDGASGLGGVWKFRTTSYNSINGIMSSMMFLRRITGGILANIPLKLKIQPKQASNPVDGSAVQIYFVTLEYDGDMQSLQQQAHQIALDRATTRVSIAEIEVEARRLLSLAAPANAPLPGDEAEEVIAEWYPEQYEDPDEQGWGDGRPPTRAQFMQQNPVMPEDLQNQPANTEPTEQQPPNRGELTDYSVSLSDGTFKTYGAPISAQAALIGEMQERAKVGDFAGIAGAWEDNRGLVEALEADGHSELVKGLREAYMAVEQELRDKLTSVPKAASSAAAQQVGGQLSPAPTDSPATPAKREEVVQNTPERSNRVPPADNTTASVKAGADQPATLRKFEEIRYGPGRGVNWRLTVEKIVEQIGTLTPEQMMSWRQVNDRLLQQMNLSWKDGVAKVNQAFADRAEQLK